MTTARRRVLVTGARGFVGIRCLPLLMERGFDVVAVSSSTDGGTGPEWRRCDLMDPVACAALIRAERPSHLLHLAWVTQPGVFWSSPQNFDWLSAGRRLVGEFYASGGVRAVALGSCAEYEIPATPCIEDATPIAPATEYGKSKAAMHDALRSAAAGRGSYAWARLFFPYGPGEAPDRFIPSVIRGLLRAEPVPCTQGRQVRDFVFVADVASACVALLESGCSGAYNVGAGRGVSLREVVDSITRHLGRPELVQFGARPAPAFDPPTIVADVGKIAREVGWSPLVSLDEGLARSIPAQRGSAGANEQDSRVHGAGK